MCRGSLNIHMENDYYAQNVCVLTYNSAEVLTYLVLQMNRLCNSTCTANVTEKRERAEISQK